MREGLVWWALPVLLAAGVAAGCSGSGGSADFDSDDDGLVEIFNLEQLDALRWDLDGDGRPDGGDGADGGYVSAFPDAVEGMGCPSGGCVGYELGADLDFGDAGSYASGVVNTGWVQGSGWDPIGDHPNPFSATFDGAGYAIAGLFIDRADKNLVGLFGEVTGAIRDVTLTGAVVSAKSSVGILAGISQGDIDSVLVSGRVSGFRDVGGLVGSNLGEVTQSRVDAEVSGIVVVGALASTNEGVIRDSSAAGSATSASRVVGGLAGINRGSILGSFSESSVMGSDLVGGISGYSEGPVSNSYTTGPVTARNEDAGGLIGINYTKVTNCYSSSTVSASSRAGGLVGKNKSTAAISGSYATGAVTGDIGSGGLVGWNKGVIEGSYATGSVAGDENDLGGLVGRNSGFVAASYATGDVEGYHRVGGLVGYSNRDGTVADAYATGSVEGAFETGGLVGWNRGKIREAYSAGRVSGERDVGGLVGENNGAISSSYWDVETSGLSVGVAYGPSEGAEGKQTAELQSPTGYRGIYEGWDADGDVWDFGSPADYPKIKADTHGDTAATAEETG